MRTAPVTTVALKVMQQFVSVLLGKHLQLTMKHAKVGGWLEVCTLIRQYRCIYLMYI